jgi:uncharacterized small protein (DUF1192 family)
VATNGGAVTVNVSVVAGGAEVTDDVRAEIRELSAQVDGIEAKHRIGLLMAENVRLEAEREALLEALKETTDRYGPNTPEGQRIRTTLYLVTGDESYIQDMPKWAREMARKSSFIDCLKGWAR